ncbi:MAG: hypothetical protein E7589_04865 [Ruminococcaceae bacterium]|nr:hypothetical protein [Oscillospiraceae bacterium]
MRKIISLALVFVVLASLLAGCGGGALPDGMSGSDAARLLLANERLDAQLLKTEGDIFENGVEVMNNLAKTAIANLNVPYVGNNAPAVTKLSSFQSLSTVLEGDYSGKVEIGGDTFTWSGFEENNNSYDFFKNITDGIVFSAQVGAELIDNIKKNVRVVDKWVEVGDSQYYLSVSENSETLCERRPADNSITVCKRYKNADGDDVYELYSANDKYEERCTYIPGKRYERSSINDHGEHAEDYFVADNSKGYWETYIVGALPTHYNVSYFIMKDDICYDAFYDPKDGSLPILKVMSADRATDIINFSDNGVSVKFSGFDGIKSVEAPSDAVEYTEGEYANLAQFENAKVHLTNGRVLNYGESFVDGKVNISAIHVGFGGGFGYTGEIYLDISGETDVEILEHLRSFLNEVGLKCRRDIDSVFAGIHRAYIELDSIIQYYTWNGFSVIDEAGIGEAIHKEKARISEMEALYTAVKDAEVLDISDTKLIEMNIKFAPITESSFEGVTLDAGEVSVDSISLTVEDTTLYVEDEPYRVMLALANANGGLVHLDMENTLSTKYADEDKFTVTASRLNFTLPALSSGSYTPVAYIATSDGIRASAYTPVTVSEIANMPMSIQSMTVSAAKSEQNTLTLSYTRAGDFVVDLTTEDRVGYEEFKALVSMQAFEYGIPSDIIEVMSGDTYTALEGDEAEIADGAYRISYKTENGDQVAQGYIYVQYSCK